MFARKAFFALLPAILAVTGIRASAQAHVNENQGTYIYVDAKSGNDGHSGAKTSPLKTIQAAVDKADGDNRERVGDKDHRQFRRLSRRRQYRCIPLDRRDVHHPGCGNRHGRHRRLKRAVGWSQGILGHLHAHLDAESWHLRCSLGLARLHSLHCPPHRNALCERNADDTGDEPHRNCAPAPSSSAKRAT